MDTTKLLKALQNSTNAYALEQEVLFLRLAAREIADLLDRIPEHQPAEEPATDEEASLCIFCGKDTWDGSRMICTDPECELSQPEEDTAGKDHLHCPQHGEPQPCNVCRAEDAEAEVADLKARLRLIRDCEADLDTLEGAEEKVLALAEQHHAYGAMIDKVREAWSASLEKRYGIKDGCWDVSRDLALAEVEAEVKRLAKRERLCQTEVARLRESIAVSEHKYECKDGQQRREVKRLQAQLDTIRKGEGGRTTAAEEPGSAGPAETGARAAEAPSPKLGLRQHVGELLAGALPGLSGVPEVNAREVCRLIDAHLAEDAAREKRHAKVREATRRIIIPIEDAICNLDKRCLHGEAHPLRAAVTALRAALEEDEDGTHSAV